MIGKFLRCKHNSNSYFQLFCLKLYMINMSKSKEEGGRYLTLNQKLEIIEKLEKSNAPSKRSLGRIYKVSETAIRKFFFKQGKSQKEIW